MAKLPESILALTREREEMLERYRQELLDVLSSNQRKSVRTRSLTDRPGAERAGNAGNQKMKGKSRTGGAEERGLQTNTPENKSRPAPPQKDSKALPAGNNIPK